MASGGDGDSGRIGSDPPVPDLPALDFSDDEETNSGVDKRRGAGQSDRADSYVDVRSPIDPGSRIEVSPAPLPSPYETHLRHAIRRLVGTPSNGPGRESSYVPGLNLLPSGNNAMVFAAYVARDNGNLYRIAGYIYDAVILLDDILRSFDGVERAYRYYSPATIARDLELTNAGEESGEFTNGAKTATVKWRRFFDTAFYQFELRFSPARSEADLRPVIDRFAALETFEIMETTESPVSLANIRRKLGHLLKIANAGDILGMLGREKSVSDLTNVGAPRNSGPFVRDVDVGIGIKGRGVDSVELSINQGDADDDIRTFASTNVSKWSLRRLTDGRRGFRVTISDTDPHAKNADWRSPVSLPLRRFVRDIWGEGVVLVNADMEEVPIDGSGGTSMPPAETGGGGGAQGAVGGGENSLSVIGTFDAAEVSTYAGMFYGTHRLRRHERVAGARALASGLRMVRRTARIAPQGVVVAARSALVRTL